VLVRLAGLTVALPPMTALLIARLPDTGLDKSLVFTLVFVFQGLHATANTIGSSTYLMELSSSIERVLYMGFAHGVVGLALFASPLGGAVVDAWGYEPLFGLSLVCGLIALALTLGLEEPRRKRLTSFISSST
jgi:MFS family permease